MNFLLATIATVLLVSFCSACYGENWCDVTVPRARSDTLQRMKSGEVKPDNSHFKTAMRVWQKCASDIKGSFLSKSDFEACTETGLFKGDKMLEKMIRGGR